MGWIDCAHGRGCRDSDVHGSSSHHVVNRRWRGCNEAYRRTDDRRHLHVVYPGTGGLSGYLLDLALVFSCEEGGKVEHIALAEDLTGCYSQEKETTGFEASRASYGAHTKHKEEAVGELL